MRHILVKRFEESQKQGNKVKSLIEGILKQIFEGSEPEPFTILCFSAFPSTKRIMFTNIDGLEYQKILCINEDFLMILAAGGNIM